VTTELSINLIGGCSLLKQSLPGRYGGDCMCFPGKVLIKGRAIAHRKPGASSFPNSAPNSEPESGLGGNTLVADDVDNPTRSWNAVQSVTTDNVTVPFQWESTWGVLGGAIKPLLAQLILCPAVITPSIVVFTCCSNRRAGGPSHLGALWRPALGLKGLRSADP
jgi:hypothetical protein